MPQLNHLALAVRDPARSLAFYRDTLGVEGTVREEEYGFVITTPGGLAFTLFRGEAPASMGEFHVGVSQPDADHVRARRSELQRLGVPELEWWEEPGYVSMKVADPDGYIVELSWDEKHSS
jgi:catechol 2,3-dioxygenase-like lactoylglutathione lyase family enzyme